MLNVRRRVKNIYDVLLVQVLKTQENDCMLLAIRTVDATEHMEKKEVISSVLVGGF